MSKTAIVVTVIVVIVVALAVAYLVLHTVAKGFNERYSAGPPAGNEPLTKDDVRTPENQPSDDRPDDRHLAGK